MKRIIVILSGIVIFQSCNNTNREPIKVDEIITADILKEAEEVISKTFNPIFKKI